MFIREAVHAPSLEAFMTRLYGGLGQPDLLELELASNTSHQVQEIFHGFFFFVLFFAFYEI